jgi:hypothetical protein
MKINISHRVLPCLLVLASGLLAQTDNARITGLVTDVSGAVLPGATVTVKSEKTGDERKVTANDLGYYAFTNLLPASYTVSAKTKDLGPSVYSNISLTLGQERALNLILQPASMAQEINVSGGELTVIDTSSARIGANVNEREVANLPLNGRQVSQLYLLVPGAQTAGSGSFDNIRFSGRANQQNAIRFDGVEASSVIDASPGNLNGETSTGFRLQSSLENIQEFRVESSNYPAEFGTGTGGQVSVVTKSGGNQFSGTLFEYLRNDAFDARNFFDGSSPSRLHLNQFGGSVGGPIIKQKMFFFGSYEGLTQHAGVNLIGTVPSAAARARAVPSIANVVNAFPVGQTHSLDPDLDVAQLNAPTTLTENYGGIRVDYRFNDKYTLYARYFRDQGESISPIEATSVSGSQYRITAVPQNGLLSFQQLLTPSVINETKFGFNGAKTRASGFAPPIPGIPDASAISIDFTGNASIPGIGGQISSAGASRLGGLVRSNSTQNGRGQPYTNYTLSFVDNLNWIKGAHSFKFGGEVRPIRIYTDRLGGTTYTFANLNDLLGNKPTSVSFLGDVSAPSPFNGGATGNRLAKQYYLVGYAQDEWKIRPNLTMSYGLRYEYYSVLHEDRNLDVVVNAENGQLLPSSTPFYKSSKLNFGPRLAFSWAPEKLNNKSVFRIGAGYYYGPGQTEDQIQPIESDRVSKTLTGAAAVFPIVPADIIAGYNINDPNLGFQPRVYQTNTYTLPEKILSYTASWQQQLPGNTVLTVAYVGSQGRNLFLRGWTNRIIGVTMNPTTGAGTDIRQFGNRFAQMDYKTSGGTDHYDSMQTTVNRRFSKGLTLGSQWTWGHSLGNTGGSNEANTTQDPTNYALDRGNNNFDVRHSVNVSGLYEVPFGPGRSHGSDANPVMKGIFGGWQVGGIWNARTGLPFEVRVVRNDIVYQDTRNGKFVSSPIVVNGSPVTVPVINVPGGGAFRNFRRPDYIAGVNPFIQTSDKRFILNPAAFAIPAPGTFGNLGRNALHGPALSQVDLTLQKQFPIREKINMEFRAEVYNIFNRANLANPPTQLNQSLGTGTNQLQPGQPFTAAAAGGAFGVASSTVERAVGLGASRQMQLSLRLNF